MRTLFLPAWLLLVAAATASADDQAPREEVRAGPEADLVIRVGDVDNLGFGWPPGFDPFSGRTTPIHPFPFQPEADDPPGTDRIMVISGHAGAGGDGYTYETRRPANQPQPLTFSFDPAGLDIQSAAIQLFVDDLQPRSMGSRYRVWLDGEEAADLAVPLNALDQTGPNGKLLTLQLLPEFLPLVRDGQLELRIDDPDHDAGDGYAFDFARLLVNPKAYRYTGVVRGVAVDERTGARLRGVLVSASNVRQALTGNDGAFSLEDVPAGLVVTTGSKTGFAPATEVADLESGTAVDLVLKLVPLGGDSSELAERLDRERKVDLHGIYFDTARAVIKPESEQALQQVLGVLEADPGLRLVIAGHTDGEGEAAANQRLSEQRAQAVVDWLRAQGVDASRLVAEGFGESRPAADNASAEGRALNRRVEIRRAD